MTDKEMNYYITHRVAKPENKSYRAVDMPEEVLAERRAFMRKILKSSSFRNSSNDELDNMLLLPVDNTYLVEDAQGYQYYLSTNCISREEAEERTQRAMIPPEYNRKYVSSFNWSLYGESTKPLENIVSKFIFNYSKFKDKGMGLYIYSKAKGSGKTMLSCIILNEISSKHGINTKFVTATDYLTMTKQSYRGSDEEVNMVRRAGLLVMDDIGTQLNREWIDSTFYELVNYRYNNKMPTIYTSNTPIDSLKMDERITDRIERNTILLKIPEKSIRKINGTKEKAEFMQKMGI